MRLIKEQSSTNFFDLKSQFIPGGSRDGLNCNFYYNEPISEISNTLELWHETYFQQARGIKNVLSYLTTNIQSLQNDPKNYVVDNSIID